MAQAADHHWLETETLKVGDETFEFKGGYPTPAAAAALREQLAFNRAVEAYLVQMHGVSWHHVWKGVAQAGTGAPNQLVLWANLMDGQTLLLTGNTETVYGLVAVDLKRDGPVVIEAPPACSAGSATSGRPRSSASAPPAPTRARAASCCCCRPTTRGPRPKATSPPSRAPSAPCSACAGSRSTASPTRPRP